MGIEREAFGKAIPQMASDAIASGSPGHHPRTVTASEIEDLYRICYDYEFMKEEGAAR